MTLQNYRKVNYRIENIETNKRDVVHIDRLKRYYDKTQMNNNMDENDSDDIENDTEDEEEGIIDGIENDQIIKFKLPNRNIDVENRPDAQIHIEDGQEIQVPRRLVDTLCKKK